MAFRFPLAAVLRLREIEEESEERLLGEILARLAQAREELASIGRQQAETLVAREAALAAGAPATQLHGSYARALMLEEHRSAVEARLADLEEQRLQQIAAYGAAHRRRELLSTMRRHQQERFASDQAKQEQKSLDELFLARRGR